jgi:hypothetical protein
MSNLIIPHLKKNALPPLSFQDEAPGGWRGPGGEVPDRDDPPGALRRELDEFYRRHYWYQRHAATGTLRSQRRRAALLLSRQGEQKAIELICALGYQAYPTTANCPFDLWVNDAEGRAARVEVKTSTYSGQGRYQANIRQKKDVDLIIFFAKNGDWWPYIIPITAIGRRSNIAIWSECPGDYQGQWRVYLEAWQHLEQAVSNSQPRSWQLSLPLGRGGA